MSRPAYSAAPLTSAPVPTETKSAGLAAPAANLASLNAEAATTGLLIINADDWGRNREATDRTLDCVLRKTVSSASAMVFMEDSERAAQLAQEASVDTGLHINLTTRFSATGCPASLTKHHDKVVGYLTRHRLAQIVYHPGLQGSFRYVISAQLEEYRRLYGENPRRVDGHHHMHLCANVLLGGLLPDGIVARRNFSFLPGQKSTLNRMYRKITDGILARSHRLTDYFFSLPPMKPANRLERIVTLARKHVVEVETHPENIAEHEFLAGGEIFAYTGDLSIAPRFEIPRAIA